MAPPERKYDAHRSNEAKKYDAKRIIGSQDDVTDIGTIIPVGQSRSGQEHSAVTPIQAGARRTCNTAGKRLNPVSPSHKSDELLQRRQKTSRLPFNCDRQPKPRRRSIPSAEAKSPLTVSPASAAKAQTYHEHTWQGIFFLASLCYWLARSGDDSPIGSLTGPKTENSPELPFSGDHQSESLRRASRSAEEKPHLAFPEAPIVECDNNQDDDDVLLQALFRAFLNHCLVRPGDDCLTAPLTRAEVGQIITTAIQWLFQGQDEPLADEDGSKSGQSAGSGPSHSQSQRRPLSVPGSSKQRGVKRRRDEDEDPERQRQKQQPGNSAPSPAPTVEPTLLFACPFFVFDGDAYSCYPTLRRIGDVRQHIGRRHIQKRHCPDCGITFADDSNHAKLNEHISLQSCEPRLFSRPGATPDQWTQIYTRANQHNVHCSAVERWFLIWDILFPGYQRPPPPAPYMPIAGSEPVRRLRDMAARFQRQERDWAIVRESFPFGLPAEAFLLRQNFVLLLDNFVSFVEEHDAASRVENYPPALPGNGITSQLTSTTPASSGGYSHGQGFWSYPSGTSLSQSNIMSALLRTLSTPASSVQPGSADAARISPPLPGSRLTLPTSSLGNPSQPVPPPEEGEYSESEESPGRRPRRG